MSFHKPTAAQWQRNCEEEAKRNGYWVGYSRDYYGRLIAMFFNGEFYCFQREWTP